MTNLIEFTDTSQSIHEDFWPKPAIELLPEWYKNAESYISGEKYPNGLVRPEDATHATIKRCVPVLDALGAGYLIRLHADLIVRWDRDRPIYQWRNDEPVGFQSNRQVKGYPGAENRAYDFAKFITPWSIKTPTGYSVLIVSPVHRGLPFHTLEGVVDTDTYTLPIAFPHIFKTEGWEGVLEAGTPIAQVIPIKRESWKMQIGDYETHQNSLNRISQRVHGVFLNAYRKAFWVRKEYR